MGVMVSNVNPETRTPRHTVLRCGPIRLEPLGYRVFVHNELKQLTLTQFHILATLARRPGIIFSSEEIASNVQRQGVSVKTSTLKTHIYAMRKRLGRGAQHIQTVRGAGYRVTPPPPAPEHEGQGQCEPEVRVP